MKYRDIYRLFYGEIPVDKNGRTYDIHHIDGNRKNNSIFNLVALSIDDHYDIHELQGDWAACRKIAMKMKKTPEEIKELVSLQQKERVQNGTHHFLGGELQRKVVRKKISRGEHHFQSSHVQSEINRKRYKNGTGNFTSEFNRRNQQRLIENGSHHFITNNPVYRQLAEGRHPFAGRKHDSKTCPKCNVTMTVPNFVRWGHGEECKKDHK